MRRAFLISSLLLLAATACSFGGAPTTPSPGGAGLVAPASPTVRSTPSLAEALRECPVTPPTGPAPPDGLPPAPYLGNGRLWVGLWPQGLVIVPADDIGSRGSLRMKFMWWRGSGARGILHIYGHEIDSGASTHARTSGYGDAGFNASSIYFPGEGCYHVTGRAGVARLSFVTLVRTCSVFTQVPPLLRKTDSTSWCDG